jgi:molybdopterin converting factor small subunit
MRVFVSTFGTDIKLREEVTLQPASHSLCDVLSALRAQYRAPLDPFVKEDLTPVEGAAILINGRNVLSLDRHATAIQDGDELTFTVMVAGG